MEESMALETRGLGLEGLCAPAPGWSSSKTITMPKPGDSAPAAAGEAARDKAATWGGMPKSASLGDFPIRFTDSAANKVEVQAKPAARVEGKTKAATFFIEPATRVDGKEASTGFIKPAASWKGKAAWAGSIEPAAKVEAKVASASFVEPAARKPEPKVVAVRTELLGQDYIQYLLKNPSRRPKPLTKHFLERYPNLPESITAGINMRNKMADFDEHIKHYYEEKGYAVVGVEVLDNGQKRLFRLSEEATA
ncbi:unnamed protein product [Urochloa decumbens]|uniref:Uncharacterized protein n=1 Tax=Urochloa decumbens TaxID=240449 RepID=A0ABC9GWX8_9POAL